MVTRKGGLWLAQRDTSARPGDGGDGWTLVVKAGAFGTLGDE